jgi:periplasmic divalent cation tolerance protein
MDADVGWLLVEGWAGSRPFGAKQRLGTDRGRARLNEDSLRPGTGRLAYLQENDKTVLVYSTFPSLADAEKEGAELVGQGLAACVNILPGMISIYSWKGEPHRDEEVVMIIKTRRALADRVIAAARGRHPYENPAFLILPVEGGSAPFLDWIRQQTVAGA